MPPHPAWCCPCPAHELLARDAIEAHFSRLAQAMRLAGLAAPEATPGAHWIVEAQLSLGLNVSALDVQRAPPNYSVMLVLNGGVQMDTREGRFSAAVGQGLVIDPADVERTQLEPGTHFVEFELPKAEMLALGAELMPGALGGAPRFRPDVDARLATQLGFMAGQAAQRLQQMVSGAPGASALFRRWCEMLALTLLQDQPLLGAGRPNALAPRPTPASLRRALELVDAHAEREILLADIAQAACVSASSLLRQFNDFLGQTPGAYVRQVRLDRARRELQRGHVGSVRALALRWGFENPSKFSQAYARRFGEKPSETRAGLR